jgi:O-antigen/teichoic acid export membrane protein
MNTVKRVAKNSFVTISAKAISSLPSILSLALVARYLSPDLFGEYIFVTAFIAVFEVFTDMGYNSILVREIARAKGRLHKLIGTAIVAKSFVALLTFVLIFISAHVLALVVQLSPEAKKAIYILGFAVCMDFFTDIVISAVRSHEQMIYEAYIIIFNSVTSLSFIALVTILDLGFISLFLARLCSIVLTMGLSLFIYTKKFGIPHFQQEKGMRKHLTREALPLGIGQVIERSYTRTNFILIRIIKSVTEVGFYGGAYKIVEQLSLIAVSIVTAVFPVFSVLSQSSRASLALAHEKTFKVLAVISLPIVVILSFLSQQITAIVFGAKLMQIAQPLKILAFAVFLSFSNLLFKFTLSAVNKQTLYRRNALIAFFVNLSAALLLIPAHGYIGACITFLASSSLLFILGHCSVAKSLPGVSLSVLAKPAAASLIMALVIIFIKDINIFFAAACGIIAYAVALIALKTFTSEEMSLLRRRTTSMKKDYSEETTKHA